MRTSTRFVTCIVVIAFALLVTVQIAIAQSGNAGASGSAGTGGTQTGNANSAQGGTAGHGVANTGVPSDDQGSLSGDSTKPRDVDGCIFRQQNGFVLVPKSGSETAMLSGQDLSRYAGQHVKVHGSLTVTRNRMNGSEQGGAADTSASSGMPSAQVSTAGAAGTGSVNSAGSNNHPDAANSGGSSSSESAMSVTRQFSVDNVKVISSTCPSDIQKRTPIGSDDTNRR